MSGHTILDKIRNDHIHQQVQVAHIEAKMRECCLKWFDHVLHRPPNALVLRCENMMNERVERGRGRPKITSKKVDLKKSTEKI